MFKLGKFRKLNSPKPIRIKCLDCHSRHSLGEKRGRPDRVRETSGRGCQFSLKLGRARRSGGEVAWEQPRARRPGGAGDPAGCGRTPLPLRHLGRFAPEPSALCCAFQLQPRPPPFWSLVTRWGNSSSRRPIASPPKQPHLPPCCCPASRLPTGLLTTHLQDDGSHSPAPSVTGLALLPSKGSMR